jgi:ABC-type phosphate/phosphonate transport system permease subunit
MEDKYTTDPKIKEEFMYFFRWYRIQIGRDIFTDAGLLSVVNLYFKEKDIALIGDIRVIHGIKNRSPKKELILAIVMAISGSILGVLLAIWLL